jgi:ankyrin repeat protein
MTSHQQALDRPSTEIRRIHPQWPLEFRGTPLAFAICAQSENGVTALLELGANPFAKIYPLEEKGTGTRSNWTAFHLAASLHCPRILSSLIQAAKAWNNNTSISLTECFRESPLGCALPFSSKLERYSIHGCNSYQYLQETVRLLEDTGACAVSPTGMTPLKQAIEFEDIEVVSALIECYPSLVRIKFFAPTKPQEWNFPVHLAAQLAGRSDNALGILKLIVERELGLSRVLSVADSSGRSPLHLAVAGRSSGAVEWLLQRDSELQRDSDVVNARDNYGRCPLHYVSTVEVAAKLFAGGAKLDARDQNGLSPLHYICARDSKDVLNWFIEQGVTLRSGDLLHSAVLGGSISIISILLAEGVPVNGRNSEGETPLHLASRALRADIVRILLRDNADTSVTNSHGQTPLHIACFVRNPTIVRQILSYNDAREGQGVFLESARSIDGKDINGQTALHVAAQAADTIIGKLLVDHGASKFIQDDRGRTPLHDAARRESVHREEPDEEAFCRLLLECRDLLTIQDKSGHLAWHIAWSKQKFGLLSLFFSTAYSLAGAQLRFKRPGEHDGVDAVDEVFLSAIDGEATNLVKTLLEQREALGVQIPLDIQKRVRSHVQVALSLVCEWNQNEYFSEPSSPDRLAKLTAHGWLEEQIYGSQEFTESLTKSTRSVSRVTVRVKPNLHVVGGPCFKFKGAILPEWVCSSFRKAVLLGVLSLNFPYYPLSRPPSPPGLLH